MCEECNEPKMVAVYGKELCWECYMELLRDINGQKENDE